MGKKEIMEEKQKKYNFPDDMLQELFMKSRDGYALVTVKGKFISCNPAYERLVQYSIDELREMSVFDVTPEKYHKQEVEQYVNKQLLAKGYSDCYEKELIRKDGKIIPIEVNLYARYDKDKNINAVLGIIRDISQINREIENHEASEKLLNITQKTALIGGWELDVESGIQRWTDQTYGIHEVDQDFEPDLENGLGFFEGEHKKKITQAVHDLIEKKERYCLHLLLKTAKGNEKWVECIGDFVENADGQVEKIYGTIQDISKEKEAEEKLQKTHKEHISLQDNLPIGIYRTTPGGTITSANKELARMLGFSKKEQLINQLATSFYLHKEDREEYKKQIKENQVIKNFVTQLRCNDGKEFWASLTARAIFNKNNDLLHFDGTIRDITKQHEAGIAIRESEERFKALFNSINDAILVMDIERNVTDCNPAFTNMFGFALHEINGKKTNALYRSNEEFQQAGQIIKSHIKDVKPLLYAFEYRKKNGEEFTGETGVFFLKDQDNKVNGYIASIRDITEKQKAAKALKAAYKESEWQNRQNTALLKGARAILDYNSFKDVSNVLLCQCKELIGATSGYIALLSETCMHNNVLFFDSGGLPCKVNPSLPVPIRGLRSEVYKSGKALYDNDFTNSEHFKLIPKGHASIKNILFAPLKLKNKTVGIIGLANKEDGFDDKDLKTAMAFGDLASLALHSSNTMEDLIKAKEEAEQADRLKTAFISNMSHEIRTPMNAILGFSEFLSKPGLSREEMNEFISIIQDNGEALIHIIDDILDIAKIEAGELKLEFVDIGMDQLLKGIYDAVLPNLLKSKDGEIESHLKINNESKKAVVSVDPGRFRQVVTNLLSNAFKFTDKGYVDLGYKIINEKKLQVFVKDTGIGIAKDKQDVIFDRFRQIDGSNTRDYGGTGIGLTITRNLVKMMKGEILLESDTGKGSKFIIELPVKSIFEEEPIEKRRVEDKSPEYTIPNLKDKTVLIAEDFESNYSYLETVLKVTNANIVWCKNGREVVEYFEKGKHADLVLMDIQMPVLNGYIATEKILEMNKDLVVIAQTAYAGPKDAERCLEVGCKDYISKPVKPKVLLNTIKENI